MDNDEPPPLPGPRRQRRLAAKYRRRRTFVAVAAVLISGAPVTISVAVTILRCPRFGCSCVRGHDGLHTKRNVYNPKHPCSRAQNTVCHLSIEIDRPKSPTVRSLC